MFTAGTGTPPSVAISGTATAAVGSTSTLTGTTVPAGGTVKWYSDDTDIATVNESTGVVTGVAAGKCNIIAVYTTADGLEYVDKVEFTVTAAAQNSTRTKS